MEKEFLERTKEILGNPKISAKEYSPLVLAYIGDGIYEVCVRSYIVSQANAPVNQMHKKAKGYVKASAQAQIYHQIRDRLTEEEMAVFKRGRNAKSATVPKHADLSDYRHATGLEALFGYLYLDGQMDRLLELVAMGIQPEDTK